MVVNVTHEIDNLDKSLPRRWQVNGHWISRWEPISFANPHMTHGKGPHQPLLTNCSPNRNLSCTKSHKKKEDLGHVLDLQVRFQTIKGNLWEVLLEKILESERIV